jgi:hypothetical protein
MKLARLVSLAVLLASAPAFAEQTENSPPNTAFLFEARLGAGVSSFFGALSGGAVEAVPSFLVGVRLIGRLHLGLGFSYFRTQSAAGGIIGAGAGTATNVVTFAPTAAFDLIRSRDERVMFYIKFGLPLGPVITCPNGAPCDNNFSIGFDLGLGVRYALHRMFSLGLEAGAGAAFVGPQRNNTSGLVDFYGALVGSFMAGH